MAVTKAAHNRMKLAFCLFNYSPYSGLSRDFLRILTECQRRGHETEVFVSTWQGPQPIGGPDVTILGGDWKDSFRRNTVKNKRYYQRLQLQLDAQSFDAVIGFNRMPNLHVYYGADFCYVGRVQKKRHPAWRLMPRYRHFSAFEKAVFGAHSQTLILSISEREKKIYQEYYHTPDCRFFGLPPTLDDLDRKPVQDRTGTRQQIRQEFGLTDDALLLLFIGSGFKAKGLDRALKALASLSPELGQRSQLMVIGEERPGLLGLPSKLKFRHLAKQLGVRHKVKFLGGRLDIPELLAAGDLLLHPAYEENTGTILLEAITAGVPVLTTDVCGYAHHVQRAKAGIVLSAPFEQDQLNRELADILLSPTRAEWQANGMHYGEDKNLYRMPTNAVDIIERYCQKDLCQDLVTINPSDGSIRYLDEQLSRGLLHATSFDEVMKTQGELIRKAPGRRTSRLEFEGKNYYLKTHTGVGWPEIIKNWTYLRLPVLGAKNEWHGVHHLERHGVDTLTIAGYGTTERPGRFEYATRQSFIVTEEIEGSISLEELGYEWQQNPPIKKSELRYKRWLIRRIAEMARTIHQSGANHRDFYLGHFLLQRGYDNGELSIEQSRLYVIDLHRMQIRRETPERWKLKDISGLRYSCLALIEAGLLTQRDLYRFISTYQGTSIRETLFGDQSFWSEVVSKAENLRAAEQRKTLGGSSTATAKTVPTTRIQY